MHWAGAVPDSAAWYGLGQALVLPTVYNPFQNVVLEAMASGLPIVTSHACGGAEHRCCPRVYAGAGPRYNHDVSAS